MYRKSAVNGACVCLYMYVYVAPGSLNFFFVEKKERRRKHLILF